MNLSKIAILLASSCTIFACTPEVPNLPSPEVPPEPKVVDTNDSAMAVDEEAIERYILTAERTSIGTISLVDVGIHGTKVTVSLSGLQGAGVHAMHFHETGKCESPDFSSAGGHYNPENTNHGAYASGGPHAGDMMNIEVNEDGIGVMTIVNERVSINGQQQLPALFDDDGSALIIHAGADDYESQPSGAAGPRIGCAVLAQR